MKKVRTETWGPFLESPETFRAHFGSHNSLCIFKTKASRGTKLCSYFNLYSLYKLWKDQLYRISGSQFYEWLFGPEKFSGLSGNRPLDTFEFCSQLYLTARAAVVSTTTSYINNLLTKRSRLYSPFKKRTCCYSLGALNRASDVSAADWRRAQWYWQPGSQGLSSLPPLLVGTETLVAAGHVTICMVGGHSSTFGREENPVAPPFQQIFLPPRFWVVTWPSTTRVSVPTTKGGREERPW